LEATFRNLLVTDWVVVLYIIALLLLVTAKRYSDYKFSDFSKLILTNTYLKTYRGDHLFKPFHSVITLFSMVFFPLILQYILYFSGFLNSFIIYDYLKIAGSFFCFFFVKMVAQLILGKILGNEIIMKHYIFEKQTYFSYLVFFSILPLLFLIYAPIKVDFLVYLFVFLWVVLFILAMLLVVNHFKKLFFSHPFYFILYLCTFEIVPLISAILYIRRL